MANGHHNLYAIPYKNTDVSISPDFAVEAPSSAGNWQKLLRTGEAECHPLIARVGMAKGGVT
jgi:hypothetical protein